MRFIVPSTGGGIPSVPTIGTATAENAGATVVFTPSTYIGKGTITYTATSNPSGITATAGVSPIIVTGLSNGTPYTFTVSGTTNYGVQSDASAASNSVTPTAPAPPPPPPPPPPPTPPPGPPSCTPGPECLNDACSACGEPCCVGGFSQCPCSAYLNANCSRSCFDTCC